jgi:hypothetical protein
MRVLSVTENKLTKQKIMKTITIKAWQCEGGYRVHYFANTCQVSIGTLMTQNQWMTAVGHPREDLTREMFADPEADLRAIWTRQGVPIYKQDAMIADTSAKATPEFMAQFFPPACGCFTPIRREDGSFTNHCAACGIIESAHD